MLDVPASGLSYRLVLNQFIDKTSSCQTGSKHRWNGLNHDRAGTAL